MPHWFVWKVSPTIIPQVTTVVGDLDPDTNPNAAGADTMELAREWQGRQKKFVAVGLVLVGAALRAYEGVAEFYATGPLAEMSVAVLSSGIGKCTEVIKGAAEARRTLEIATQAAADADRLVTQGKTGGKSAEEIKSLEEMAQEFRTGQEVRDAQSLVEKEAEMERIFDEACRAKAAKDPHYFELGSDLDRGGAFNPREAETGSRLEAAKGRQLRRTNRGATGSTETARPMMPCQTSLLNISTGCGRRLWSLMALGKSAAFNEPLWIILAKLITPFSINLG